MRKKKVNLVGESFGRLTVIKEVGPYINLNNGNKSRKYLCKCSCSRKKEIVGASLSSGRTKSCGCFAIEVSRSTSLKHGYSKHTLYNTWSNMKNRCYNINKKDYKDYGGRGITVCDEWKNDPKAFIDWCLSHGWKKGLLLDRKNNNLGYSPENCRYTNSSISSINRRMPSRNSSGYVGVEKTKINTWTSNIKYNNNSIRIGSFKDIEEAIEARNRVIRLFDLPHKIQQYKEIA